MYLDNFNIQNDYFICIILSYLYYIYIYIFYLYKNINIIDDFLYYYEFF